MFHNENSIKLTLMLKITSCKKIRKKSVIQQVKSETITTFENIVCILFYKLKPEVKGKQCTVNVKIHTLWLHKPLIQPKISKHVSKLSQTETQSTKRFRKICWKKENTQKKNLNPQTMPKHMNGLEYAFQQSLYMLWFIFTDCPPDSALKFHYNCVRKYLYFNSDNEVVKMSN